MSKKGNKNKRARRATHPQKSSQTWLWGLVIGSVLLVGGLVFLWQQEEPAEVWGLPATPRDPRPSTLPPALFTGKAREAYRIAREAPELLERMPCYCGCYVGNRHQNNLDCYVDRHAEG